MGRILKDYPDIAETVMLLIEDWYPDVFRPIDLGGGETTYLTGRIFPQDVQDLITGGLAYARVQDIGGNDDGLTDRPLIDIDILASTFAQARDLSKGIQSHLLGAPWRINGVVLDRVKTAMRPHDVPWDDDNIFRFYASYTVAARRRTT